MENDNENKGSSNHIDDDSHEYIREARGSWFGSVGVLALVAVSGVVSGAVVAVVGYLPRGIPGDEDVSLDGGVLWCLGLVGGGGGDCAADGGNGGVGDLKARVMYLKIEEEGWLGGGEGGLRLSLLLLLSSSSSSPSLSSTLPPSTSTYHSPSPSLILRAAW